MSIIKESETAQKNKFKIMVRKSHWSLAGGMQAPPKIGKKKMKKKEHNFVFLAKGRIFDKC